MSIRTRRREFIARWRATVNTGVWIAYNPEVFRSRAKTAVLVVFSAAACGWAVLSRDAGQEIRTARLPVFPPPVSSFPLTDSGHDGTPDFLRLHSPDDRRAFRNWFCYLAEQCFFRSPEALPSEVSDCSGLVRFAYRETLQKHDGDWASRLGLQPPPAIPPVLQYSVPNTPLGSAFLRVRAGEFRSEDLTNGSFAQFADAQTLVRRNCFFVSRDVRRAKPGDLVLYRQPNPRQPFHLMVYLGPSRMEEEPGPYLVYHTGTIGKHPGEVRRPAVRELLNHPLPQWRPVETNEHLLGVFRWNILRWESDLE